MSSVNGVGPAHEDGVERVANRLAHASTGGVDRGCDERIGPKLGAPAADAG
jgi:hypothetical protein